MSGRAGGSKESAGPFSFGCDLLDPVTNALKRYNLAMWPLDASVEVYDPTVRRTVLKRCRPREAVTVDDFFLGNTVTIMARPFVVREYLGEVTRARFASKRATSMCVIKPDALAHMGTLMDELLSAGFDIGAARMVRLSREEAEEFYSPEGKRDTFDARAALLCADAVLAISVSAEDAVSRLQGWAGPADPAAAREALPDSIRARFGTDEIRNAVHVSATSASAAREADFLTSVERTVPAEHRHCSAVVIRPHAVRERAAGKVVQRFLDDGLEVSAVRSVAMEGRDIESYLEAYRGVIPEHGRWMTELSSGTSIVLEIRGDDAVRRVREICGPYCPEIARHLRPSSLRAVFGKDRVCNAVMCTDVPADGPLESKYLLRVVDA